MNQPAANKKALFIVFEGIDGAGKTTQALILRDRLLAAGREAVYTREPTNGPWGQKIRRIASQGRAHLSLAEELSYFLADRAEHVAQVIAPACARGAVVISDRYFYSTIAYQSALGLPENMLREKNAAFPRPDLVIIPQIPVEEGQERIAAGRVGGANPGYEKAAFLEKVKAAFDRMADPNIRRLDGTLPEKELAAQIFSLVGPLAGLAGLK